MDGETATADARIAARLVGRERELELILSAVTAQRDIVLEGPPGTSKTTLLQAVTDEWGIPLVLVEGNAELTPARLVGHHDPSRVLREGYVNEAFVPGPLVEAMRAGGFLYIEEFNRAPDDTLNVLLMALADRQIAVPRYGVVRAASTFRVVASMNPFDHVGTTRLSTSITDRFCRLTIGYQDEEAEREIVQLKVLRAAGDALDGRIVRDAVALTRATRSHADLVQGSSVRGAIDTAALAAELTRRRAIEPAHDRAYHMVLLDAALVALSGRVRVDPAVARTPEEILTEIWENAFILSAAAAEPG